MTNEERNAQDDEIVDRRTNAGAFTEDALSEFDASESAIDLPSVPEVDSAGTSKG